MSVTQDKNGKFLVHVDRKGMPRVRKSFSTQADAEQFERDYIAGHNKAAGKIAAISDNRSIYDLIPIWFKYHGINLSYGEGIKRCLEQIAIDLNDPPAISVSIEVFVDYRYRKMLAGLTAKTLNNHHKYLSAMYERLHKLGIIDYDNPIAKVDLIKIHERQLSYLSRNQIDVLLDTIRETSRNDSVWYVVQICLRTGARWGEVEKLRFKQLRDGRVTYEFTKSKKTRTLPLEPVFYAQLMDFAKGKSPEDRVFSNCLNAFRGAMGKTGIVRPAGQCSHMLRHSFASTHALKYIG